MASARIKGARQVRQWCRLLAGTDPAVRRALAGNYGDEPAVLAAKQALFRRAAEAFAEAFGPEGQAILVRATGRVNLLGTHVDHRGGYVNPVAVGELILFAQGRDDDRVVLRNVESERFGDREFRISRELPPGGVKDWDQWTQAEAAKRKAAGRAGDWSDYIKSAVLYFQHLHTTPAGQFSPPLRGMNVMVYGTVPAAAGLSSSSALVVAAAEAVRCINGLDISDMALVDACAEAEWYIGTRGGGGDHAAIKFGKLDHVTHIGSFPLTVDWIPFPADYRIVLANSLKKAEKSVGAKDIFNQRVACYIFGLMLARKNFPQYAPRLEHLRDLNPRILGTDEVEIYRILGSLPETASRQQIRQALADESERVEHVFGSHAAPAEGYKIRQVCLYGVSECLRSEMAADRLRAGDIRGFGELLNLSHDGDRVSRLEDGKRVPNDNSCPDEKIAALMADLSSGDPARCERARLWRQPGGYNVSTEELDELVDIARATPGVVGAGLVGAGLGGSVVAVVEAGAADSLIENYARQYYQPHGLEPAATVIRPVGGGGLVLPADGPGGA